MQAPNRATFRGWGAVTGVSELKRHQRLRLLAVFLFGNVTTLAVRPLLAMKVIALGRWTLWPSGRTPRYLLFETNWSGSDQTYIPDFARIMPNQWKSIWGATKGFPGPLPTTRLLNEYVARVDAGADHFWTDYEEGATTKVIASALELRTEIEDFLHENRNSSPAEFRTNWQDLLVSVQGLL